MGTFTSLTDLSESKKQELVASLATLLVGSAADEISAESLSAVAEASGNSLSPSYASLFSSVASSAGGIDKFCAAPGSGGGGGGGAASGGAAAADAERDADRLTDILFGEVEPMQPSPMCHFTGFGLSFQHPYHPNTIIDDLKTNFMNHMNMVCNNPKDSSIWQDGKMVQDIEVMLKTVGPGEVSNPASNTSTTLLAPPGLLRQMVSGSTNSIFGGLNLIMDELMTPNRNLSRNEEFVDSQIKHLNLDPLGTQIIGRKLSPKIERLLPTPQFGFDPLTSSPLVLLCVGIRMTCRELKFINKDIRHSSSNSSSNCIFCVFLWICLFEFLFLFFVWGAAQLQKKTKKYLKRQKKAQQQKQTQKKQQKTKQEQQKTTSNEKTKKKKTATKKQNTKTKQQTKKDDKNNKT